jgi:excisionase family DNA binding protein
MTNNQILAVGIAEAVRLTGMGRSSLYSAIKRGELPIRKSGRRTLLMIEDIQRWLANLPTPRPVETR